MHNYGYYTTRNSVIYTGHLVLLWQQNLGACDGLDILVEWGGQEMHAEF